MKRVLSLACVLALALSLLVVVPAASAAETALNLGSALTISDPGNYIGAMIDASIFTVGKSYKLEFNVTGAGTGAFRVRYSENFMENGPFNDGDFVNSGPDVLRTSYQIPAYFTNAPLANGETATLTVYFKHGELQSQGINYVGLFGGAGGSDYIVNSVKAYELSEPVSNPVTISDPGNYIGAMIDASVFTVGKSYKLEFNVTGAGTGAFRVRYSENFMENGPFNDGDFVNSGPDVLRTSYQIPAYFTNAPLANGETATLTVYFKHGDLQSQGINYVGLFGGGGGSDYIVNSVKAYELSEPVSNPVTISDPGNYIGAMIDASIFTVGSAYKLEFNVTSAGTTAFRVRYSENFMENGPFYDGDFVSADPAKDRGNLDAYQIPAFFTNGPIADGDTVTLTVYFKHGDLQSQGINYVGLFGGSGGSDYIVNSVKVTAIESVPDVPPLPGGTDPSTPPTTPPVDPSTPPVDPSVPPTTGPGAPTGDNGFVFVALGLLALTGLGVVVLVRKSKA